MKKVHKEINYSAYPPGKDLFQFLSNRTFGNLDQLPARLLNQSPKKIRVLSLGCGMGVEFSALKKFFDRKNIDIEYIGIDINRESIKTAKAIYKNFTKEKEVQFYCLDASKPEELNSIGQNSIDLIILQHPYLLDNQKTLKKTFIRIITETIPAYLSPSGCLYVSFYHQNEIMFFGNLEVNGKTVFRGRTDKIITNTDGIQNRYGETFIPEQYTWISQTPLQFNIKPSSTSKCCWAALFTAASAATVIAAETVIRNYVNSP